MSLVSGSPDASVRGVEPRGHIQHRRLCLWELLGSGAVWCMAGGDGWLPGLEVIGAKRIPREIRPRLWKCEDLVQKEAGTKPPEL